MTTTMENHNSNDYETPLSVSIAEAIAEKTGREITDFSLYDSIDPDALNTIFSKSQSEVGTVRVVFNILDYTVVVEQVNEIVTVHVE